MATFRTWLLGNVYTRRRRWLCHLIGHDLDHQEGFCNRCTEML